MKFNFFFISYTVIYAKYNHCYEISRDMPVRYFDGKEWKFMKQRHNIRTRAPRYTNITTELEWDDLIKEIKEIDIQREAPTQMLPTCRIKTKTKTTEKITTSTRKTTTKRTTTKKITTKMTTPKLTIRKTRPFPQPTTTTKATVKNTPARCKPKLKTTTTTTIDPRIWQTPILLSEDWIDTWTRVRPTKKHRPIGQDFLDDPSNCKPQYESTTITTTVDPMFWQKQMITSEDWINIWTRLRPTKKPSSIAMRKYTTKYLPTTSTTKRTTVTVPVTKTKKLVILTEKPVKYSGTQGDDGNRPEYWSNLMREFLTFVELKKCRPPCEYGSTTPMSFAKYMLQGDKRMRADADEITNILMNDVEIDENLSKLDDDVSQDTAIMQFEETYEADEEQRLNFESLEDLVSNDSKINKDNEQDLDFDSFKDSFKVRRTKPDVETSLKSNNVKQDYETQRVSRSEANFDELKVRNAIEEDEVLQDGEINSYLNVLKEKHTIKVKDSEKTAYLDAENGHTRKVQDEDIRKRLGAIKDKYTQRYKDSSQYVSRDPLNFKELNRIADYVATKRTYSTDSIEMRKDNEDFLQNEDMTFDLGTLEEDHGNTYKYSTDSIELRDLDAYAYADAVQDINEQNDDKTINSYENVIPLFNFKYPLNENMTN